mmetsp:Transcript_3102/g.9565  ORF Transcript_3102/g.9565 Transcript_3102/m.9565 type:complete len:91 (+) Transcript_3102:50-322(+)
MMMKKTCIITGASAGIGCETALAMARRNYKVICAVRDGKKMERALMRMQDDTSTSSSSSSSSQIFGVHDIARENGLESLVWDPTVVVETQ